MMTKRKTVTFPEAMSQRISELAGRWNVSESEAMRRLFALGSFFAGEINKGSTILMQENSNSEPVKLIFPAL